MNGCPLRYVFVPACSFHPTDKTIRTWEGVLSEPRVWLPTHLLITKEGRKKKARRSSLPRIDVDHTQWTQQAVQVVLLQCGAALSL